MIENIAYIILILIACLAVWSLGYNYGQQRTVIREINDQHAQRSILKERLEYVQSAYNRKCIQYKRLVAQCQQVLEAHRKVFP